MSPEGARALEESVEQRADRALAAGNHELAATLVLREYGGEVTRFLAAFHRDHDDAAEVFSEFAEALWRAVPSFERRSSLRTWMYAIARRVSLRHRRDARRRRTRFEPFTDSSAFFAVEAEVRSATLSYLRTERRTRLTALRESLPVEDQMLLVLRVDRKLAWNDLAIVLRGDEAPGGPTEGAALTDEELKREAARLRKRFQVLKEKLRELGRREGLLDGERGRR
jgi:RNA polymerase sigma-70 factor (ECF subfamily)